MTLINHLNTLESTGLIRLAAAQPELEYLFRHALVQDAAYGSLLRQDRKQLHLTVGEALERLYPDQPGEQAATLAYHFEKAGVREKAVHYFQLAGDRARASYANTEAVAFYQAAISQIKDGPSAAASEWRASLAQLHEDVGDLLEMSGQHDAARSSYDRVLALVPPDQLVLRARIHCKQGNIWLIQGDQSATALSYDEAERALGDEPLAPLRDWWQAWLQIQLERIWLFYVRNAVESLAALIEKTEPVLEQYGTPPQRAKFMTGLINLSNRRSRWAPSEKDLGYARAGFEAVRESGDLREIAISRFVLGLVQLINNDLAAAEENMQSSYRMAERIGDIATQVKCLTYLSVLYRRRGQMEETRRQVALLREAATKGQMALYLPMAHANAAWLAWRAGHLAEAATEGQAALEMWRQIPPGFPFQWPALWTLVAVSWRNDQLAEAVGYARGLIAPTQQYLPDDLTSALEEVVRTWEQGESETTRSRLGYAIELAQKHGYL